MNTIETKPQVSVIIPTYNRGWVIEEAIDSVLAQDYTEFELIVVDDGSTDDTSDVLDSYGDDIKVLSQKNKGVSAARNRGLQKHPESLSLFLIPMISGCPKNLPCRLNFLIKRRMR